MFRLVRLASCGPQNGSGPKTEALPNGPKTVPKRKRSQNGSAPKMVPKRKRSQNGSGPKTEALPNVLGPLPFWDHFGSASVLGPFGRASVLGPLPFWDRFRVLSHLGGVGRGGGVVGVRAGESVFLSHFWTPDQAAFKPIGIGDVLDSAFP